MIWTPAEMAAVLNRLPFVEWDRFVEGTVEAEDSDEDFRQIDVYGWIARDDGRSDFVVATFVTWSDQVGYVTSSAARDEEICQAFYGRPSMFSCERVDEVFGDLVSFKATSK